MLTKDQQKFFFNYFKNVLYNDDKITIEEIYKKIEDPEVREIRDNLLREAEKKAIRYAKVAVRKIKNKTFEQLLNAVQNPDDQNPGSFGEDLLDEIEKDLR